MVKTLKQLIFSMLFFAGFLTCYNAQAATYYVDESSIGGICDDSNAGTATTTPWCTIYKANETLVAGDTVYIRAGHYSVGNDMGFDMGSADAQGIHPANSGTEGNIITYSTYPGEVVNFEGILNGDFPRAKGINLEGKNYVHVTGIEDYNMVFTDMTQNFRIGYNTSGNHNEIDHCDFGGLNTAAAFIFNNGTTITHDSQYNYVHDNKIHDWQKYDWDPDNSLREGPTCMYIGGGENDMTNYNVIEDNIIYHCGEYAVGLGGMYNVFRNNIIHNEDYWTGPAINTFTSNETLYPDRNIYGNGNMILSMGMSGGAGNNLIENNRIGQTGISMYSWYADGLDGKETKRGGTSFIISSSYNTVRYNAFFGSVKNAVYFGHYPALSDVLYNHLYNNTFYSSGYSIENEMPCYERLPITTEYDEYDHDNVIKNNLFRSTWGQTDLGPATSTYEHTDCGVRPLENLIDNNSWPYTIPTPSYVIESNLMHPESSDSPFVNADMSDVYSATLPDLHLAASATAVIDQASALTTTTNSGSSSTVLEVNDARYFQDGKFGQGITWPSNIASQTTIAGDWIAIGTVDNIAQISSINSTTSITLFLPITWSEGDSVWLYKKSDGTQALSGSATDYGAYEYIEPDTTPPAAPTGFSVL